MVENLVVSVVDFAEYRDLRRFPPSGTCLITSSLITTTS